MQVDPLAADPPAGAEGDGPGGHEPIVGLAAARAAARLGKVAEMSLLEGADLSLPQYRLMVLLIDGSAAASALADRLTVTRPSITALADGLVDRGYVERRPDPDDRRRMTHTITSEGRAALARGDAAVQAGLGRTVAHLPEGEAGAAIHGLDLWLKALDAARLRRSVEG